MFVLWLDISDGPFTLSLASWALYTIQQVIFKAKIFAEEAKFKFRRIKISKITNFEEFSTELAI